MCDKKGKPQLSWRVLILPYIEQDALYKEFKTGRAVGQPTQQEADREDAEGVRAAGLPSRARRTTYYRVFVGNGAGFDWVMGSKIVGITDGTSNTLMCVTAATAVTWTKPDELEFDPEKDMLKLIGMVVNGKAQVAMFDGSVRTPQEAAVEGDAQRPHHAERRRGHRQRLLARPSERRGVSPPVFSCPLPLRERVARLCEPGEG